LNPTVGFIAGNAAAISIGVKAAHAAGADLAIFPELALCGYPPKDLLMQEGFLEECHAATIEKPNGITIAYGLPRRNARGGICNSLRIIDAQQRTFTYDKRLLPTYDVFDEDRYFTPGNQPLVVDVAGVKVGFAICEDLWRGVDAGFASRYHDAPDPVSELMQAEGGKCAQLIISPSASPFVLGKNSKHREIVRAHALRHGVAVASVNQLGGNDELVFDGHAFIYDPTGTLIADGEVFTGGMVVFDLPIRGESKPQSPSIIKVPAREQERDLFDALVLGIRDYLRKTGFKSALLGLSGGIDSALTAVLAAAAIGPANITGVALPSKYSSDHSKEDAYELARRLGVRCLTVPIETAVEGCRGLVDDVFAQMRAPALGATLPDLAEENLQSRLRGTILMAMSNRTGAIVLTTGNKSELAVGYCTLYGDMNGGLAVLSDVTKLWVYRLSRWINTNHAACGFASPPIPQRSIDKAPSAELRPDQTDQDSLPPYEVLDAIIERYIEGRQRAETITAAGFDSATVTRVLRMIDLAEYKRKQAAIGLKVTSVAFGSGRRWPIAARRA